MFFGIAQIYVIYYFKQYKRYSRKYKRIGMKCLAKSELQDIHTQCRRAAARTFVSCYGSEDTWYIYVCQTTPSITKGVVFLIR